MEAPDYRVKQHKDGSVDVWVDGRRIHFPVDGKPSVSEEQAPSDAAPFDPGVSLRASDSGIAVGCRGRLVLLRPDGSSVVAPEQGPPASTVWRSRIRRARG